MKKTFIAILLLSCSWVGGGTPAYAADENLQVQLLQQVFRLPQPEWPPLLSDNRHLLDQSFFERCDARIRWGIENNQIDDALRISTVADTAMKVNGQKGRYRMTMIHAFLKSNNMGMAKDVIINVRLTDPDDSEAKFLFASILKSEGDVVNSYNAFKELISAGYHRDECLFQMGLLDLAMERFTLGEQELRECLALNPNHTEAQKVLDRYLAARPKLAPPGTAFNNLPLPPSHKGPTVSLDAQKLCQTYFDEAEAYFHAGEIGKAKLAYGRALEKNPTHVKSLVYLGALLYRQGDVNGAIERLTQALGQDRKDVEALRYLGYAFERRFDAKGAKQDLEQAAMCFQTGSKVAPGDRQFKSDLERVSSKRGQAAHR